MNLSEFTSLVSNHPDKLMRFVLPNGKNIPASYHITEVGHSKKDFIDCGGTVRSTSACLLQAWVAANDEDHRLQAGKLADILKLAGKVLPSDELPVEIEYEAPIISQFTISQSEVADNAIVFHLENKHTDCLAKESCGLEGGSCCSDESETCGTAEQTEAVTSNKTTCC